ncbi:hypothetical protein FH972_023358 [Carpinus fangiana]|uniref:DNA primase n=1 Tax=Carpinus fangiana TaxID=176857 RepID=A0A5N6KVG2_9ROSI|nr:hypothetical protein FH972_023358 [Carpinus fangiana]
MPIPYRNEVWLLVFLGQALGLGDGRGPPPRSTYRLAASRRVLSFDGRVFMNDEKKRPTPTFHDSACAISHTTNCPLKCRKFIMPHAVSPDSSPTVGEDVTMTDDSAVDTMMDTSQGDEPPSAQGDHQKNEDLEAMFDDEDDDEFTASSAPDSSVPAIIPPQSAKFSDPEVMRAFYQRLFPYKQLFHWLNHSAVPNHDFQHREFAFTLANDVYLRYQSFPSAELFRKQCVAQTPSRFEIGPVYSTNPRDRKTLRRAAAFKPLSKELVFDIDMTDYDEIRTCCSGGKICLRCWSFMKMAIKVLDVALREDFGFQHILWVYSGRRGVHAWVCDKSARQLDDNQRKSIATYLELLKGGDNSGKKVNARRPLHPHIERSLAILREHFQADILQEQDPWLEDEKAAHLLSLLPDETLIKSLQKKWGSSSHRSSKNKWADIDDLASSGGGSAKLDPRKLREAKQDIVLEYTYPRLDAAVSKHLNHLLKSPFCVHPGTGRVCVPIDPSTVDDFDPLDVPTVTELLGQVDQYFKDAGEEEAADAAARRAPDWEKTRLKPYVEYFRGFVNNLVKDEQNGKRKAEGGEAMEF